MREGGHGWSTDEGLDVHIGQGRLQHTSCGKELLTGRCVGKVKIGKYCKCLQLVGIGVGIDGVEKMVKHGEPIRNEGRIVEITIE